MSESIIEPSDETRDAARPAASAVPADATPMMAQYLEIKQAYPDALLFYRMGDFYEMFFDDAVRAADALDIALTKRGRHLGEDIAMCGVPVHAHESYLERLIRRGFRVAVCEQTEDPAEAKKRGSKSVVRREVIRLVTPGTLTEETLLDARAHNYLAALARTGAEPAFGLAWADVSTGEFAVTSVDAAALGAELARLAPGELLVADGVFRDEAMKALLSQQSGAVTALPAARFDSGAAERRLKAHLGVAALDGFGSFARAELAAMGALLDYVELTQVGRMPALAKPRRVAPGAAMAIDAATRANLELVKTLQGETRGSLLSVIDRTVTGAGGRELGQRLAAPLTDPAAINERLDAVEWFLEARDLRERLRTHLRAAPDMARALTRASLGRGGPRDLAAIRDGLGAAHEIARLLDAAPAGLAPLPAPIVDGAAALRSVAAALRDRLAAALGPDLPLIARDGGFIAHGFSAPLDELRMLRDESRRLIAGLQSKYADETEVSGLKIRHNNVLGYHIEVGPKHAERLLAQPLAETYIHRQTLANAVRFTTGELAGLASRIAEAGGRVVEIELELFGDLVAATLEKSEAISRAAAALGELDVAAALAELAVERRYTRPRVDRSLAFRIEAGRHPVVEAALERETGAEPFVPNDCDLTGEESAEEGAASRREAPGAEPGASSRRGVPDAEPGAASRREAPGAEPGASSRREAPRRLWLLTGPNMAGKSTFLRQNALIAILAQTGSFVPAASAHIGIVDRLFSRVGAADDLARGRSTFMVEMVETAAILNQAGPRSLVILDEIGRGTATFDGLSIAWAAVEHLHEVNRSRALFATHYHELTALAEKLPHLANATMRVKEWEGEVVFLHEVGPGAADRSYGIQVAKLAGLPPAVIARAREVLTALERDGKSDRAHILIDDLPLFSAAPKPAAPAPRENALEAELKKINPDELTPREALEALYRLKALEAGGD